MTMKTMIKTAAVLCLLAAPALANETAAPADGAKPAHKMRHHGGMFKSMDTDKDGNISKAEADANFDKIDANKDGKISKDEMKQHMEQKRAEWEKKKAEAEAAKGAEAPKTETK